MKLIRYFEQPKRTASSVPDVVVVFVHDWTCEAGERDCGWVARIVLRDYADDRGGESAVCNILQETREFSL